FQRLGVVEPVVFATAVAGRDEEVAFGAELELAAVVVGGFGVGDRQQVVGDAEQRGAAGRDQFGNVDFAGRVLRVGDVEAAAAFEVGREGDREQPALAFAEAAGRAADDFRQVGEVGDDAAFDLLDQPGALDDEEPFGVAGGGGDVDRFREI